MYSLEHIYILSAMTESVTIYYIPKSIHFPVGNYAITEFLARNVICLHQTLTQGNVAELIPENLPFLNSGIGVKMSSF